MLDGTVLEIVSLKMLYAEVILDPLEPQLEHLSADETRVGRGVLLDYIRLDNALNLLLQGLVGQEQVGEEVGAYVEEVPGHGGADETLEAARGRSDAHFVKVLLNLSNRRCGLASAALLET